MGTGLEKNYQSSPKSSDSGDFGDAHAITVSLLTGGSDRPYVFGLTTSLISKGATLDMIGSDELDFLEFRGDHRVAFLNLRGSLQQNVSFRRKIVRILVYYLRLIRYAALAKPGLFHILWNNKFAMFDRTLLMLYYRLLRKKIVLTVHNVNADKRDSKDTRLNRLTLRIQYHLAHHIFVHTEKMKRELIEDFGVPDGRVTVIPFGINNAVPNTHLTPADAKQRLGLREDERVILFFGRITPYKGLEYLISAFRQVLTQYENYRLIIAGKPDKCEEYWRSIRETIREDAESGRVMLRADFIPDDEVEVFFKAADALVLPYRDIYQSGVLFLGQSFGLPVLAADVGSLRDEIVEGETGFVFEPESPSNLARAIDSYFTSDLYRDLDKRRSEIRACAIEQHSWAEVSRLTMSVYASLLRIPSNDRSLSSNVSGAPLDVKSTS
jgi:glycosyltransferase involved in cell wall biosynthesis